MNLLQRCCNTFSFLGLLAILTGCPDNPSNPVSDGGTTTPASPVVQFRARCESIVAEVCSDYTQCGIFSSQEGCLATIGNPCETYETAISENRMRFNATVGVQCLDTIKAMDACSSSLPVPAECLAFGAEPVVPAGGACKDSEDCTGGNICTSGSTCPGQCSPPVAIGQPATSSSECGTFFSNTYLYQGTCQKRIAAGESCAPLPNFSDNQECVSSNYCDPATKKCRALPAIGEPCFNNEQGIPACLNANAFCNPSGVCEAAQRKGLNEPCDGMNFCKVDLNCQANESTTSDGGMTSTCVIPVKDGESCATGACAISSFCEPTTKVCVPYCGSSDDCSADQYCGTGSTCQPRIAKGADCDDAIQCASGLVCSEGKCSDAKALGATCSLDSGNECQSGSYCDQNTCVAQKAVGASCQFSIECLSEYCGGGKCRTAVCE